jgi:hypothetical protein
MESFMAIANSGSRFGSIPPNSKNLPPYYYGYPGYCGTSAWKSYYPDRQVKRTSVALFPGVIFMNRDEFPF